MLIVCPKCYTKYRLDENRLQMKPTVKLRCPQCSNIFEVQNPLMKRDIREDDTTQVRKDTAPKQEEFSLPSGKTLYLFVIKGPRSGYKHKVETPYLVIGRGSEADLILPDLEVSRKHCALEISGDKAILKDLDSTNGVFVGGERISSITLEDRTEFTLGQSTILFMERPKDQDFPG